MTSDKNIENSLHVRRYRIQDTRCRKSDLDFLFCIMDHESWIVLDC